MKNTQTDQIEEIKKAETDAKKLVDQTTQELQKKEANLRESLATEIDTYQKHLKQKKNEKVTDLKTQAEKNKEAQISDTDTAQKRIIDSAEAKEEEALSFVMTKITQHLKAA